MEKIKLTIEASKNKGTREFRKGISLVEVLKELNVRSSCDIVAAKQKNEIRELTYTIDTDSEIKFVGLEDIDGFRIYTRSLIFLLIKAVKDLHSRGDIYVRNSISEGTYCDLVGVGKVTEKKVKQIEQKMRELVNEELPFTKIVLPIEKGKKFYKDVGLLNKYNLIEYTDRQYVTLYELDGLKNYFYGYMVPNTGFLTSFELVYYGGGLIVRCPTVKSPKRIPLFVEQKKILGVFKEFKDWNSILGIENVGMINKIIHDGKLGDYIRVAEALQEKKIAHIADMICSSEDDKKLVLIAGPSSSGKTTFSKRLEVELRVNKKKPVTIGLDDYFLDRKNTPRDEEGNLDYESIDALDIKKFNQDLVDLIAGKEVEIPIFNFKIGARDKKTRKLKLADDSIIVIEGIHGLNDALTASVDSANKFKIYVSALTTLNLDEHNRIYTTDNRLLRRIVRDNQFRGIDALETIERWHLVRKGEEKNIFPFQENADVIFNSALMYEIFVLKGYAEKLLKEIDNKHPQYIESKRLLGFLSYFLEAPTKDIPQDSLLKEFIGGSCFEQT
ncbi:MAG: nucleoside kinase [Clostridiales bacterium]|nr:nucleoside kinase [Clostridiales bacterium]